MMKLAFRHDHMLLERLNEAVEHEEQSLIMIKYFAQNLTILRLKAWTKATI
jgi:hypothetical protein